MACEGLACDEVDARRSSSENESKVELEEDDLAADRDLASLAILACSACTRKRACPCVPEASVSDPYNGHRGESDELASFIRTYIHSDPTSRRTRSPQRVPGGEVHLGRPDLPRSDDERALKSLVVGQGPL